ncbi:N-acetyltaurine hydrolase [Petromyzon marinus]|uniref:N-acetyltaurine hydrolase n=2 Tax=Petromyzon marinus TaxID=7757 RepID=A0AAJ7WRQ8_PETMA|nr:phosphotriesterase-related protein [Petromyzon marinus]
MADPTGLVQTVLGPVAVKALGVTLPHEHLSMAFDCCFVEPPAGHGHRATMEFSLSGLHWIQQHPYSHRGNLRLGEEEEAVRRDLLAFREAGGGALVENSTTGLCRDMGALQRLSRQTGVHVVAGTGFYVASTHTPETQAMTIEQLAGVMRGDLLDGVDGTAVRCGVIGELGCSWPLDETERRVLQAAGTLQADVGCPVIVHPGRHISSPADITRVLLEAGGKAPKIVMSHLDRTLLEREALLEFATLGTYLEFDLFGTEILDYQLNLDIDMPSDNERIHWIEFLLAEGLEKRLLVSHDIHTKHRLTTFGGHGFEHILTKIAPKMLRRGMSQHVLDCILRTNPQTWLAWPEQ